MNAYLVGFLEYINSYKKRNVGGWVTTDDGYNLSNAEVRAYVRWCVRNGYKYLYDAPPFETVKDKLNIYEK
jgi:hypothetical protein